MRISALLLGCLLAAGCSSAANKKLDELADRACACTDAPCAEKVEADLREFVKSDPKGNEDQAKKSLARLMTCVAKAKVGVAGGKAMEKMMEKAMEAGGKAMEAGGKAVDKAGEAADKAGEAADKAGEAADKAGEAAGKDDDK
jgi:hypothetical protein